MTQIKFGTSGWRAVIGEEFTFANVRRTVTGIARYVRSQKPNGARILVGRDPRFLGEMLTPMAAGILAAHGIQALLITEPAPTPAIAHAIMGLKADGAINFTASHNPPEYSGIKFSTPDGAPALPEATSAIETLIAANGNVSGSAKTAPQSIDPKPAYLARLKGVVDLPLIRASGLKVVFDPLWGAARGYSDELLREAGIPVSTVHDVRDVLFGGHAPEPEDHLLDEMRQQMKVTGARIGIA